MSDRLTEEDIQRAKNAIRRRKNFVGKKPNMTRQEADKKYAPRNRSCGILPIVFNSLLIASRISCHDFVPMMFCGSKPDSSSAFSSSNGI